MAINLISYYSDITNTNSLLQSVEKQRQDFSAISLTEFNNSTVPRITAGSTISVDGSLFLSDADTLIAGSPSDGAVWIKLVGQSTGPNPEDYEVVPTWTNITPVWDEAKQGYYENGNERVVAGCTKSGASYTNKFMLNRREDIYIRKYGTGNVEIVNDLVVDDITCDVINNTTLNSVVANVNDLKSSDFSQAFFIYEDEEFTTDYSITIRTGVNTGLNSTRILQIWYFTTWENYYSLPFSDTGTHYFVLGPGRYRVLNHSLTVMSVMGNYDNSRDRVVTIL